MTSATMPSVSAAVRSRVWSFRNDPFMRTRGGEPTLQCRSDPPDSTRARKNGSIVTLPVTVIASTVQEALLTVAMPESRKITR